VSNPSPDDRAEYDPTFFEEADLDEGALAIELLENASEAMLTIDAESRIVYANPAVEDVLGYTPRTLVGRSKLSIIPERLRTAHETGLRSYIETGERHIDWDGVELPALHKAGHEIPALISLREHRIGGDRYFTGIIRDVSDRKANERQLRERRRRIETLHKLATTLGEVTDVDACFELVVDAAETVLAREDAPAVDVAIVGIDGDDDDPDSGNDALAAGDDALAAGDDALAAGNDALDSGADTQKSEAYRTDETVVINDRDGDDGETEFRSMLSVPIGDHGVVRSTAREPNAFDEDDRRAIELLAAHAAAHLARIGNGPPLDGGTESPPE